MGGALGRQEVRLGLGTTNCPTSLAGCSLAYQAHLPCVEPAVYLLRTVLSAVPDAVHLLYDEHNLADVAVVLHVLMGGSRFGQ